MTDTLILKTLTEEKSRILNKQGGKELVLKIELKSGKQYEFTTDSQGAFYKEPELINGALKVGVTDLFAIERKTTDVNGVVTTESKQPVIYKYIDPAEINAMTWEFKVITTNVTGATTTEPADTSGD